MNWTVQFESPINFDTEIKLHKFGMYNTLFNFRCSFNTMVLSPPLHASHLVIRHAITSFTSLINIRFLPHDEGPILLIHSVMLYLPFNLPLLPSYWVFSSLSSNFHCLLLNPLLSATIICAWVVLPYVVAAAVWWLEMMSCSPSYPKP